MVYTVLVSADKKMAFQIKDWLRELANDVRLETFSSLAEFAASCEEGLDPEAEAEGEEAAATAATAATDDGAAAQVLDPNAPAIPAGVSESPTQNRIPLRLLIVDLDLLDEGANTTPLRWFAETKAMLERKGYSDPIFPSRILALAFDGSRHRAENMRDDSLDDLVLKPLDRELFLQKAEILVADKPNVKPSFLFRQKTNLRIEAGKDAIIDELSEYTVAIRNPAPLVEGMVVAIHSELFGLGADSRLLARVFKNVRHPSLEGEFLVRFSYFGVRAEQLATIRKYVRAHHVPMRTKPHLSPAAVVAARGARAQALKSKLRRRIAVIDLNRRTAEEIKSIFDAHFVSVDVQAYSSYTRFLRGLLKLVPDATTTSASILPGDGAGKDAADSALVEEKELSAFPSGNRATVVLSMENFDLIRFEPSPGSSAFVLGRAVSEWINRADLWRNSVFTDDKEDFSEFLGYLRTGAHGHAFFRMNDASGATIYLEAEGRAEKTGDSETLSHLQITFRELKPSDWTEKATVGTKVKDASSFRFDAIYIDGSVIQTDVQSWMSGLKELMVKAAVMGVGESLPKIMILCDAKSTLRPEDFKNFPVTNFVYKPFDRKYIADTADALIPGLTRIEEAEANSAVPCEVPVRIAKDVVMGELAEYGLTILQKTPIKSRIFMRFFSPIFGDGSQGIIGRCVTSAKVGQGDKVAYECHFVFFGVSDTLFSRVRTWIREEYVQSKDVS
jgi:hypothetical protein